MYAHVNVCRDAERDSGDRLHRPGISPNRKFAAVRLREDQSGTHCLSPLS